MEARGAQGMLVPSMCALTGYYLSLSQQRLRDGIKKSSQTDDHMNYAVLRERQVSSRQPTRE